ncbi:MAG: hypothetical protein K6T80_01430 [Firmicutes bacterium]|nr:hypothetical protein [Bacillota bacterium]
MPRCFLPGESIGMVTKRPVFIVRFVTCSTGRWPVRRRRQKTAGVPAVFCSMIIFTALDAARAAGQAVHSSRE